MHGMTFITYFIDLNHSMSVDDGHLNCSLLSCGRDNQALTPNRADALTLWISGIRRKMTTSLYPWRFTWPESTVPYPSSCILEWPPPGRRVENVNKHCWVIYRIPAFALNVQIMGESLTWANQTIWATHWSWFVTYLQTQYVRFIPLDSSAMKQLDSSPDLPDLAYTIHPLEVVPSS